MKTAGRLEMQTPFTDGEIFLGPAGDFTPTSGAPTLTRGGAGLLYYAQTTAATVYMSILSQILRTGQLATAAVSQQEFGTAALVPGPSSVANTSDPLNLPAGFPPQLSALNPTLTGGYKGPIPKGIQINWVDVLYSGVGTITPAIGLTQTIFSNNVAPAVTSLITLGINGLPTAAQALPYRSRVTVASPKFFSTDGTEPILEIDLTAATSLNFYGAILGVSFNYN